MTGQLSRHLWGGTHDKPKKVSLGVHIEGGKQSTCEPLPCMWFLENVIDNNFEYKQLERSLSSPASSLHGPGTTACAPIDVKTDSNSPGSATGASPASPVD